MLLDKTTAILLQQADNEENRLPSPPSKDLGGQLLNRCPRCWEPCTDFPWSCPCGWEAVKDPDGCCTAIHNVVEDENDKSKASYPVAKEAIETAKGKPEKDRSKKEKILANLDPTKANK